MVVLGHVEMILLNKLFRESINRTIENVTSQMEFLESVNVVFIIIDIIIIITLPLIFIIVSCTILLIFWDETTSVSGTRLEDSFFNRAYLSKLVLSWRGNQENWILAKQCTPPRYSEGDTNSIRRRIVLKPGIKFQWQKVPGARTYLLRLSHADLKANSFVSDNNVTSIEIPFSSLIFNSNTGKKPTNMTVAIEVLAIDKDGVIGKQHYPNVEIHASATASTISLMTFLLGFVFYNVQ